MTSPFPIRYVDKSDPVYRALPTHHIKLKPPSHGATSGDMARVAKELRLANEHKALSEAVPHSVGDGQGVTLDLLKGGIIDIISKCDSEWLDGCEGIRIMHHPDKREKFVSILSRLPVSSQDSSSAKLLSVSYNGRTFALKIELYENKFMPSNSLAYWLDNPSNPAIERLMPADASNGFSMSATYRDKRDIEEFALDAITQDLIQRHEIVQEDINSLYEPLGDGTFPDFELSIKGRTWGIEVTRVETGLTSYITVGSEREYKQITKAADNYINDDTVHEALQKALSDKTGKCARCSSYSRYGLLLIDMVEGISGKDSHIWNDIDLCAFDAVTVVRVDGTVSYIKGSLVPK